MSDQKSRPPRFNAVIITAAALGLLFAFLVIVFGRGRVVGNITWFVPMMQSFATLAAFSVAFLSLGRYQVLGNPAPYWIGTGFAGFGVLSIFFVLAWPGLLSPGEGLIARLPSTSGWIAIFGLSILSVFLIIAALAQWPDQKMFPFSARNWPWSLAAWISMMALIAILAVRFERYLPALVDARGDFIKVPLVRLYIFALLLSFIAGAVFSLRCNPRGKESILGYAAITQVALAYTVLTVIIGQKRYGLWYYLGHVVMAGGFIAMMFGLLSDYVQLFRREQEKAREREVLLGEIYHRTKNNMNVISSLIDLQARQIRDGSLTPVFRDIKNRIQSMALVHEKLYASKDLSRLKAGEYVKALAAAIMETYGASGRVSFVIDVKDLDLNMETAIPVGLVLNELISNSLKHAFPPGRAGKIQVSFAKSDGKLELKYADSGEGLPAGFDISRTASLGLKIVFNLIEKQLGGTIEARSGNGTEFYILIPER